MSIVRKSTQTLIAHILVSAQGLLLTPIIVKVSGTEVFGGYVLALSYLGLMFGISSFGVGISAKRWLPSREDPAGRSSLFFPQFTFQLVTALALSVLTMLAFALASSRDWLHLEGFTVFMIPSFLIGYIFYSQPADYFRYTHRVGIFNVATVVQPYLFISLSLLVYFFAGILNPGTLVVAHITASLLVALPLLFKLYGEIGFDLGLPKSAELTREIRIGFPLLLAYLVDMILAEGDKYLIACIMSVRDVGIYAPAYALGSLAIVLPKVFGVVLPPLLSQRVDANDSAGARQIMSGSIRAFLLVSVPFVFGSMVLGERVLRFYTNEEVSRAAWPVIPLVALGSIFYGLILLNANLLFVRLKTGALFRINAAASVLNVVLNIVLLLIFKDVIVAAVATLASYLISYLWLRRILAGDEVAVGVDHGWLIRLLSAAAIMGGSILLVLYWFPVGPGIVQIGAGLFAGFSSYALLLLTWKGIGGEEIAVIRRSMAGQFGIHLKYP